jgi:hypothetical protein
MGHNPRVDLCPKSIKKMKKFEGFWRNWVSEEMGRKWGKWDVWQPAVGGSGRRWCGGWLGGDGWRWCVVGLDFREYLEEENGEGRGRSVRRYREIGEEWEKLT